METRIFFYYFIARMYVHNSLYWYLYPKAIYNGQKKLPKHEKSLFFKFMSWCRPNGKPMRDSRMGFVVTFFSVCKYPVRLLFSKIFFLWYLVLCIHPPVPNKSMLFIYPCVKESCSLCATNFFFYSLSFSGSGAFLFLVNKCLWCYFVTFTHRIHWDIHKTKAQTVC